ncbi:MAG: porin family protein [Phocaeicola sp.]|uniref:porin family protein n=1 Tax=Phocaeicola sp. TaxID=2773926 RepID=UPI003F9FFCBE
MKKLLMMTVAMIIALHIHAQQKAGTFTITPKVGLTVSNFSGNMPATISYAIIPHINESTTTLEPAPEYKVGSISFSDSKEKTGFIIGAEGQYQFTSCFGMSLGVFYTQEGARYKTKGYNFKTNDDVMIDIHDNITTHLDYISLPVLANVYIWRGLALKAGIQPEVSVNKKIDANFTVSYKNHSAALSSDNMDNIRSFAISVPVGISYEYKNIVADLRYHFGLTDLKKDGDAGNSTSKSGSAHNRMLSLTIGYKFRL